MQDALGSEDGRTAAASLTIVALGASAGGLEALKAFFGAVKPHPVLAYVVVTHLPASHESHLNELLGRVSPLPVAQARDGEPVQAGQVYVSAPGALLGISGRRLTLDSAAARTPAPVPMTLPIDHFMSELADDVGDASVGIVLSGTAHDGTAGLKAIRAAGGLTLVQLPETAEFPGMPNSAIGSGMADQVLAPQDMPAALVDYLRHVPLDLAPWRPGLDADSGGKGSGPGTQEPADDSLLAVLRLVQRRTGHDFRWYRPAMLLRRLRRRMGLCKLDRVQDYLELLAHSNDELECLKNEFLIGVTDFFRDPPAWEELAQTVIPAIVADRVRQDAPIRVWTPGCATGEESYSIAMLLLEQAEGQVDPQRIQVFGTDIDLQALAVARAGAYPSSIVSTVSTQRLARFFDRRGARYVVRKPLRDTILFAAQNLVRDTPFSRLDLVLCRNLLIYFKPELQQRVFELFHFALNPGGMLLLGKAESIGSQTDLFAPASRDIPLYRRIGTRTHLPRGFGGFSKTRGMLLDDQDAGGRPAPSRTSPGEIVHAPLPGAPARATSEAADATPAPPVAPEDLPRQYEQARQELAAALADAQRSNEELRTVNEESLALNEELQSSNEELESSKEELESLNEELTTVNAQLDEKLAELAHNNDDLNNLLVSTGLATILLDAGSRIRRFTPAATEAFSLQPGDEGRPLSDIASHVDDPDFKADLARVAESGAAATAEVRSPAGAIFLRRILPYRTQAGPVEGAVVTFTDVTALRDATRRARELVAVLQDSNDAIISYDGDGRILAWNDGAQRMYGHAREAVLGTTLFDLLPPAEQGPAIELTQRVMASGQGATLQSRRLARGGTLITVSITVSALRDTSGAIHALLSTERDISDQLRAQSEMYFRRLADHIPVLLRVEDAQGFAQFVNQPCSVFMGRPRQALLGEGWLQFLHPQDLPRYISEHAAALSGRARLETDLRMRRADGAYRWMRSISVPHFDDQGAFVGYIGLMVDVEDHKVAESALRDADARKDDFLAMLAHELRNPLAPIRNAVAVIARSFPADTQATWAVDVIGRQTELLARLLDDLLDVARIARGKVSLEKSPVDLGVLVQRAVEICQPLVNARHHQLSVDVRPESLLVEGDLMRLTQVLANLLTNAAKYMDEGGQIHLEVGRDGEMGVIRVRDTGMGMTPQLLALVFDPFMQADASLERSRGGLGLGLTLVKQLVDLHGGTVEAHSAGLGQGSEFIVRLPLMKRQPAVTQALADSHASLPGGTCRVLVVDDNHDAAQSLAILLQSAGHEVSVAFDGQEALEVAARCDPQVVILDVGLPRLDGYQVARCLRGAPATAHAKLIALTGYGQPDDVAEAREAGFDHHFVKPADPQAILSLVANLPSP